MKKGNVIFIHIVFWVMFVFLPYVMFNMRDFPKSINFLFFLKIHVLNFVTFYLTYFALIPFLLKRKSLYWQVARVLIAVLTLTALRVIYSYVTREYLGWGPDRPYNLGRNIFWESFWCLMFVLYALMIYFSIAWFKERQIRAELTREKQQSEIDLLKSQINPHFLMNTINNLYALVYQGSRKAGEGLLELSHIMRYMLYETNANLVPLENEIKYLRSFIDLQLLRLKNKEAVDFRVVGDPSGRMIAPMLFIPFIENAFKHGNKSKPGVTITIRLVIEEKKIFFSTENFKTARNVNKPEKSGIGLSNIRKRLELQYPGRHLLEIDDQKDFYSVHLTIEG